jgi:hypothetical protein
MKRILMTAAVAAAFTLVGCTSMSPTQQGTASGAAIGAVTGAGIVALTGGSAWTGAAASRNSRSIIAILLRLLASRVPASC